MRKGVSFATSAEVRGRMQRQLRSGTGPELALRRAIHRLGLRFGIDRRPLPNVRRRADLVFRSARVAVFVDGCFWHGCPSHGARPKSNSEWWRAKIEANRRRDSGTDLILRDGGWYVLRAWAHDDTSSVARRVASLVRHRRRLLQKRGD